ncbi:MAG: T9SS type A sorting domain-containing protein [Saprospiraceae bacterium]|nr:T9SS type A sorting domain-containing protein [Saprospiraceae bacterium]
MDDGDGCVYDLNYPIEVVPASNLACLPCDSLQAEILGDLIIDCTTTSIDTVSVGTTNLPDSVALYQWTLNGVVVSSTPSVNIQAFGTYIFTVTNALNGCSASDTLVFSQNTDTPIADAGPDFILSCLNPTATLDGSGSSAGPQYQYQWTGPGILDPDVINPIVNEPGVYTLTVINLANGCTATDETLVLQDSGPILPDNPFIIVPDSCHLNTGSISFVYNGPLQLSLLWSTGDTTNTISGLSAGAYGLHILYGNCETNFTIQVDSVGCTGTTEVLAGIQFQVLPNPNSGQFSVLLDVDSPTTLEMELVDVLGRTVSTLQPPKAFGTGQHRIDFQQAGLPSGTYYLVIKNEKGRMGVKVEVVR